MILIQLGYRQCFRKSHVTIISKSTGIIITARIRRMTGGYIFTLSTLACVWGGVPHSRSRWGVPHLRSGWGGYPVPGLGGGYPISGFDGGWYPGYPPDQVWMGGVPHPRSGWWGGTPSQVWVGGGTPSQVWGVPHLMFWWGVPPDQVWLVGGYPIPGLDGGGGYLGYPWTRSAWWGHCISGLDGGGEGTQGTSPTHSTEQHSEHLLRGGQCASCVHAGGLSC